MLAVRIVKTVTYPQSYRQSQNSRQTQTLTIDLKIYLFRHGIVLVEREVYYSEPVVVL